MQTSIQMTLKDSFFNTNQAIVIAWAGNTFFSGASIMENLIHQSSLLTMMGWIITSIFAVIVSIYRIKQIKAETNKTNAITCSIESKRELTTKECLKDDCQYKIFHDKFIRASFEKFKHEE